MSRKKSPPAPGLRRAILVRVPADLHADLEDLRILRRVSTMNRLVEDILRAAVEGDQVTIAALRNLQARYKP